MSLSIISTENSYRIEFILVLSCLHNINGNRSSKHYIKVSQVSKIKLGLFYKIKGRRKEQEKIQPWLRSVQQYTIRSFQFNARMFLPPKNLDWMGRD